MFACHNLLSPNPHSLVGLQIASFVALIWQDWAMAEAIDTLKIADHLKASGLERQQAKGIVQAVRHGHGDLEAGLAGLET